MSTSNYDRIMVFGNEETVTLFELLGIEGKVINDFNEFELELYEIIKNPMIGMILISENILSGHLDFYLNFKLNNPKPFIFLLPDIFQSKNINTDLITKKIQEYIGKAMH
ncbi:MAG: V-type ATP synthase subunit F [Promethearchaeota archaeon]